MKKFYKHVSDLTEYNKKYGNASYLDFVTRFINNLVLCNKILKIDKSLIKNIVTGYIDEYDEVFQAFIIDINDYNLDTLKELKDKCPLIISYSDLLESYVLLVTHFGTGWDYVNTSYKITTEYVGEVI